MTETVVPPNKPFLTFSVFGSCLVGFILQLLSFIYVFQDLCDSVPDGREYCKNTTENDTDNLNRTDNVTVDTPIGVSDRYQKEKESRLENWTTLAKCFQKKYHEAQVPSERVCCKCSCQGDLFRCIDCCPWECLCYDCLSQRHSYAHLHIFEIWKGEAFLSFRPDNTPCWTLTGHKCDTTYVRQMTIIDEKGRQHCRNVQFCKCQCEAVQLVSYSLWPATLKHPQVAFHFDLMLWMQGLLMEGALSITRFCSALEARCPKHQRAYLNYPVKDIYKILITSTADEFRNFWYCTQNLNNLCEKVDDGTDCPACFQLPSLTYSFDADFQLVRKVSSGKQWKAPKHHERLFLNQEEVDTFIENYSADSRNSENVCSDFQAGNNLRSKNKNKKLSEKAVFGSACRHEMPKFFFSLKHGERLGYAVYLLRKLLEDTKKDHVHIMYDIACSLHRHLKKNKLSDVLEKTTFSIPIFHAYGHKVECQILYGPRRTEGLGLTDGECMERIWSYLGRFANITKEMTPENRIDLLTDALLHYGQKIKSKLGITFPQKLQKAIDVEKKSREALQELLKPFPDISDNSLNDWCHQERIDCSSGTAKERGSSTLSMQEQYSLALEDLENARQGLPFVEGDKKVIPSNQVEKRLQAQVKKLSNAACVTWNKNSPEHQRQLCIARDKVRHQMLETIQQNTAERLFLIDLMKKYARGQAVASRLGQQLKKINQKIRDHIAVYNSIGRTPSKLPGIIDFEQVKSSDSEIWDTLQLVNRTAETPIPLSFKQQATRLFCQEKRAAEEQLLIKSEMHSTLQWYLSKCSSLLGCISDYSNAEKCALVKEGLYLETSFNSLLLAFQPYLDDASLIALNSFTAMVGLSEVIDFTSVESEREIIHTVDFEDFYDYEEDILDTLSDSEKSEDEYSDSDLMDTLHYIQHLK